MTTTASRPSAHRRPRTLALALAAGALAVGTAACTGGSAEAEDPATDVTSPEPDPVVTTEDPADDAATPPTGGGGLLDGGHQVDIQTYGGEWVTTTVEGGVTTVADPAEAGGVPTTWVFEPLDGGVFHVRTTATTDGQGSCLSLPGDDVITVATCDPAAADQQLAVATLDQPEQVNISAAAGVVVADQEGGLALDPDPSSPASVFTLVDRGAAEG